MIDKSSDYLYQNSTLRIWYLSKTAEGSAAFNTNSVVAFKATAGIKIVDYVVRNMPSRTGALQIDHSVFHLWRIPCAGLVPALGDKLFDGEWFWLVDEVEFMDRDDLLPYNRYRLSVTRSKLTVVT